jgi:plastocyanin
VNARSILAATAAVLLFALAGAGPAYAATSVSIGDNFYSPTTVTVSAGTTITWTYGSGNSIHSVTADNGSFDSSPNCPPTCMNPGDSYTHTFTAVGSFPYHCRIHGSAMAGTVVVEAAGTNPGGGGGSTSPGLPNTGASPLTGPFVVLGLLFLLAGGAVLFRLRRRA